MEKTAELPTVYGFKVMANPNITADAFAIGYPGKPFVLSTGGTIEWSQVNKPDDFGPVWWPSEDAQ